MDANTLRTVASDPAAFQAALFIPSASGPQKFASCMAPFQRERFASINAALVAVANGQRPEVGRYWFEATKGASKDSDLAVCLLWLLAFTKRPLLCQVGAADADQAAELKKAATDILRLNHWLAAKIDVLTDRIVCKRTESVCEVIAADVPGSHGARPDLLILNEASHVRKKEFAENLLDNATKIPNCLAVVATNAGFLDTWQWSWRELARTSPRWHFHRWSEPSPWLNPEDIREASIRNAPARFNRLWHGVWSSGSGDALDPIDIEACTVLAGPLPCRIESLAPFVGALDLGLKNDHSALVVLGVDVARQQLHLASCESWAPPRPGGQVSLEEVKRACVQAFQRFDLAAILYDPWQAALMAEQLEAAGIRMIPWTFVPKNMDLIATELLRVFRNRQIDIYPDKALSRDLGKLSIVERAAGFRLVATRDEHGHADRATALAMAIPTASAWMRDLSFERSGSNELAAGEAWA